MTVLGGRVLMDVVVGREGDQLEVGIPPNGRKVGLFHLLAVVMKGPMVVVVVVVVSVSLVELHVLLLLLPAVSCSGSRSEAGEKEKEQEEEITGWIHDDGRLVFRSQFGDFLFCLFCSDRRRRRLYC